MKRFLISAISLAAFSSWSGAANCTFSKDGSHAYLLRDRKAELVDLDFDRRTFHRIDLSIPCEDPIQGVALSNAGNILCSTRSSIWSYNPSNEECVKVCDAPKDTVLNDVAYDPKTGNILVIGYANKNPEGGFNDEQLYLLPKDNKELMTIWNRYDEYAAWVSDPIFNKDGALFFVSKGDLWEGTVEKDDKDIFVVGRYGSLVAKRDAPIAQLITQNTTPASTGLIMIAPSKNQIYGCYARMGGSGWGAVIRFKCPSSIKGSNEWKSLGQVFSSVETIEESPSSYLCSSKDGSKVLYATYSAPNKVNLINGDEKRVPVDFEGLASLLGSY